MLITYLLVYLQGGETPHPLLAGYTKSKTIADIAPHLYLIVFNDVFDLPVVFIAFGSVTFS